MSKIYMKVTLNVLVESDMESVEDMMDYLDFSAYSDNEDAVEVYNVEVEDFEVTDAK